MAMWSGDHTDTVTVSGSSNNVVAKLQIKYERVPA